MLKIAVLVCNPCAPDHRVNKQAEFLASKGHHVRVYCRAGPNVDSYEVVHGVEYIRVQFNLVAAAKQWLPFGREKPNTEASGEPTKAAHPLIEPNVNDPSGSVSGADIGSKTVASNGNNIPASITSNDHAPSQGEEKRSLIWRVTNFAVRFVGKLVRFAVRIVVKVIRLIGKIVRRVVKKAISIQVKYSNKGFRFVVNSFSKALIHHAFATTLRPYLEKWNPDIVHAHDLNTLPAAVQTAQSTGAKVIYDAHELETHRNPPPPFHIQKAINWIEKHYIAKANSVITVCDPIADHLRDLYNIERPYVVMNTPEYPAKKERKGDFHLEDTVPSSSEDHWRFSAKKGKRLRNLIDVSGDKVIAVYVGLLTINRGVETVVEALQHVPNVVLVTVGPSNLKTVESLKKLALEKGVSDRFILLPPVPASQVIDFIEDADFGVCPIWPATQSYDWALPNKLFEMTFAGLPIVASNTQEVSRFLKSNEIGLIYKYNDAEECAARMKTLLENTDSYRLSEKKISEVREAYAWQKQTKIIANIYDQFPTN